MKYSACIDMMYSSDDFYDRFTLAKQGGMDAVEFWKWSNKDISRVKEELEKNDLQLSIFNIDCRDEALSYDLSRGILNAGRSAELLSALEESAPVYHALGASAMIVLIGETKDNLSEEQQNENIRKCLTEAAPLAEKLGVTLIVEPLNATDRKNYYMPYSAPLFSILRQVNSPRVKMLFDIYHQQMTEGHLCESITNNIDLIGHFHVADVPGRHEPGTGEINYPHVLRTIASTNYAGYIGLEYRATRPDNDTLGFIREV